MNVTGLDHKGEYNEVSSKTTPDARKMPGQVQTGQRSIERVLNSSSRWQSLTDLICYCVAKDMLPLK